MQQHCIYKDGKRETDGKEREFREPMKRGQQAGATTMVVNEKMKLYVGDANSARCANWSFISRVTPSFEALLAHL
jgi:hypothetical protein